MTTFDDAWAAIDAATELPTVDDLLAVGTAVDWLSPVLAYLQDLLHGGGYTFAVPCDAGYSGGAIVDKLHERGIETWGHMIVNGRILFTVPAGQADQARAVLETEGMG
jgi:hypothetical protein